MSTRARIVVSDNHNTVTIYRHCDGYPDTVHGVLAGIEDAKVYAWPQGRYEAGDFAAALVRAWKGEGGGNIYIDNTGGLAFIYTIGYNGDDKELMVGVENCYSGKGARFPLWSDLRKAGETIST